jgi:hypothetical protein
MRIKFIVSIILCVSIGAVAFAQTEITPDERLYAKYSSEYLNNLSENQPQLLEYLNFELDNGFVFVEIPGEKAEQFPYLRYFNDKEQGDIVLEVPDGFFNLALYEYERNYSRKTTYRIGSNKAIVFHSIKEMTELFNTLHNE